MISFVRMKEIKDRYEEERTERRFLACLESSHDDDDMRRKKRLGRYAVQYIQYRGTIQRYGGGHVNSTVFLENYM